ncbi:MAG: MOSC N-terminal beta barrel domain-containing protein [Burkholderiales bacterium]
MTPARIAALNVYPVKGCGGVATAVANVRETGLALHGVGDREWMVVDGTGRFVTQREFPRLALVHVAAVDGALTLTAPDATPLTISLAPANGAARDVVVWHSDVRGFDAGDAAADWLSARLAADVRLVRFDPSRPRICNPEYAGGSGAHTMFADGYPILVIGASSLVALNERLAERGDYMLPMDRFRPNVVVEGLPPFEEDHLATIASDGVMLKLVKPCVRCQVTTTNQQTAAVGVEPLRTLGEFRMDERMGGVTFGMNAVVVGGAGRTLTAGARATVEYRF